MKKFIALSTTLLVVLFAGMANAGTIAYNTGSGDWKVAYSGIANASDATWEAQLKAGTTPLYGSLTYGNAVTVNPANDNWGAVAGDDLLNTPWISMAPVTAGTDTLASGFYVYKIAFNGVTDTLRWCADNNVAGIYIDNFDTNLKTHGPALFNEDGTPNTYGTNGAHSMGIYMEEFTATSDAWHTLYVVVQNTNEATAASPTALWLEMSATSQENPTPEPATIAIFGFGLIGAGIAARRRNRK